MELHYTEFAREITGHLAKVQWGEALDAPYESGLPSCRRREVRRVPKKLPMEWMGKVILFGPPQEGWVFVTRARRLRDAIGHGLATPEVAEKFGVRCASTRIVVRDEFLELTEEP